MTVWERVPEVVWRRSGGRRLVMGPDTEEVVVIEGSGQVIWDLLDQPIGEDELARELSAGFGIPTSELRPDIVAFLTELRSAGLVAAR